MKAVTKVIALDNYKRLQHFNYFKKMAYPYVGITVDVDLTGFMAKVREKKYPFFLSFLWCVSKAANEVEELRQRIYHEGIIEFEQCYTSHTVAKEDGTYCYCRMDCNKPFDAFLSYAATKHEQAKHEGDISEDEEETLAYFFISCIPWITFSSLIQPASVPADSNPRIIWGKYYEKEGKWLMPVSILCHHALVDGRQLADFYEHLQRILQQFSLSQNI